LSAPITRTKRGGRAARISNELLFEQYRICVHEYRFQVELNWKRSQYYFVLNAAILIAGAGLLHSTDHFPRGVPVALFGIGVLTAVLAGIASHTQRNYMYACRDRMKELAIAVGLRPEQRLKTAEPEIDDSDPEPIRRRIAKMSMVHNLMLLLMGLADLAGVVVALADKGGIGIS
jgi:hypothetical protein